MVDVELVVELVVLDVEEVDVDVDDVLEPAAIAPGDVSASVSPDENSQKPTLPKASPPRSTERSMNVRFDIPDQSKARRES